MYFCVVRNSKIAPYTAIIEFPDEQINQFRNKIISSQHSN